jgi:hypothetical protein
VFNYIFSPPNTINSNDADIILDLKILLHELYNNDQESNTDFINKLFDKDSYTKYAHKLNKKLENDPQRKHGKFLQTISYSEFLELFKDVKGVQIMHKMHENYVQYMIFQLRELPDPETMKQIVADIFCDGRKDDLQKTLADLQSWQFTLQSKQWNNNLEGEQQKKWYIFDGISYTKRYL